MAEKPTTIAAISGSGPLVPGEAGGAVRSVQPPRRPAFHPDLRTAIASGRWSESTRFCEAWFVSATADRRARTRGSALLSPRGAH